VIRNVIEHYHQIKPLQPCVFTEINGLKAAARARGANIIDFSMGNPDMPTTPQTVDELVETINKPRTRVVRSAKRLEPIILSDYAYAEFYFDGAPPPSDLQISGAIDVTVEFTSSSKTYHWPGLRIGFTAGNERPIAALARVKLYLDYGAFTSVEVAAAAALNGPRDCDDNSGQTYRARLVESFLRADWKIPPPSATMFAFAPIPDFVTETSSVEFAKMLIQKADVVASTRVGFGEYDDGYVRMALVERRIRQGARNIKKFLARPPLQNVSDQ
jgi:alanine-synthesizing transaminase